MFGLSSSLEDILNVQKIKILVIYSKTTTNKPILIHGGAKFVWPVIQDYGFLDLKIHRIDLNLKNLVTKDKSFADININLKCGISCDNKISQIAADRIFGLSNEEISSLIEDICKARVRFLNSNIEDEILAYNHNKLIKIINNDLQVELNKFDIKLISSDLRLARVKKEVN